ncbi:MAG: precorrin-6A synthase (deacetylating) [Pseudomonadota bacterium]
MNAEPPRRAIWLVGIGTGSPAHLTLEGQAALREAAAVLLPRKGDRKEDLAEIRERILRDAQSPAERLYFDYPERDGSLDYQDRVAQWHDEIARRWERALADAPEGPVALLVWGDPSLYDSTMRIAARIDPRPEIRVVPGITALQALTAAHSIPLNEVGGSVEITTGRNLAEGWPSAADTVAVMLDGECRFAELEEPELYIWWGAYLGMDEEILHAGALPEAAEEIVAKRQAARARHGWLMDTYLLKKTGRTER